MYGTSCHNVLQDCHILHFVVRLSYPTFCCSEVCGTYNPVRMFYILHFVAQKYVGHVMLS